MASYYSDNEWEWEGEDHLRNEEEAQAPTKLNQTEQAIFRREDLGSLALIQSYVDLEVVEEEQDVDEKSEEKIWNRIHPLLKKIPVEIWESHILRHFSQKEVTQTRLVCHKWKEIVDGNVDFNVTVDDKKIDFAMIGHLRIKECKITRLNSPDQFLLTQPGLLRKLEILKGGVFHPVAFQRIVDAATGLEELTVDLNLLLVERSRKQVIQFSSSYLKGSLNGLQKLKRLTICADLTLKTRTRSILVRNLSKIFSQEMRSLERITLRFYVDKDVISCSTVIDLLQLLPRTPKLKELDFYMLPKESHPRVGPEALPVWEEPICLPKLKKLSIQTTMHVLLLLRPLLDAESSSLTRLCIALNKDHCGIVDYPGIPSQILSKLLLQNAATLVSVNLHGVRLSTSMKIQPGQAPVPFDVGVLRNALNLRVLIIVRYLQQDELIIDQPNLINFLMLPSSLEKLWIFGFTIQSVELESVVQKLDTMKLITLMETGERVGQGVTDTIARLILDKVPRVSNILLGPVMWNRDGEVVMRNSVRREAGVDVV